MEQPIVSACILYVYWTVVKTHTSQQTAWRGVAWGTESALVKRPSTHKQVGAFFQMHFYFLMLFCYILVWNWFKTMNILSALWILMVWYFSTRTSVATVLNIHRPISPHILIPQSSPVSYILPRHHSAVCNIRADFRFAPSQWEMSVQSSAISHWLGANLESALNIMIRDK